MIGSTLYAQDGQPPAEKIIDGYAMHQSIELGGHIANYSGSNAVYDTMVNLQTGLRILNHSLEMRPVNPAHSFFDHLSTSSFGYGGDPNNVSVLRVSKSKWYEFSGTFRRDRQYFDYDLLANPLIPDTSVPFIPILDSPHLFNTVRRMTDVNVTLLPLSVVHIRFGYSQNVSEGPSFSTLHTGAEALLQQNWRNSTDTWTAGLDWKPLPKTTFSYDQFITHYKGDTTWQLTGLNYKLSNGTPESPGIDVSSVWKSPCASPFNPDGSMNPTCNGYLDYHRYAPTRTLFPTEQFLFQSSSLPKIEMNGRLVYTGTTGSLHNFDELFNGLVTRTSTREETDTGFAATKRVSVTGNYGITWRILPKVSVGDQFDFWDFRNTGTNQITDTSFAGASMLVAPGAATTTVTPDFQTLNQRTKANTLLVAWDVAPRVRLSIGHRYRSRLITNADGDAIPIHENWGLFGAALQPTPQLRVNFNVDAMYADNAFTRISPRQLQHYRARATYKVRPWMTFAGTVNLFESRDNVQTVNHLEHNRDFSFATTIAPGEHWSIDMNYAYDSVFSRTDECYVSSTPPPSAGTAPAVCQAAGLPSLSNGYYNQPTQYGSIGFTLAPVKKVRASGGYRMTAINGNTDSINARQVPGSLQSQYQSPYADVELKLLPEWSWKANYNYYGYGEGTPIGPTAPRSFRGNVYTLSVRYAF